MQVPGLISLSTLVKTTADELRAIHANEPAQQEAVMKFTECEIEVGAVVGADVDGKVKFWVIEAGASGKYENTQKVTLKFTALPNVTIQAISKSQGPAELPKGPERKTK